MVPDAGGATGVVQPGDGDDRHVVAAALRLALGIPHADDRRVHWRLVFDVASRELIAPLAWARSRRFISHHASPEIAAAWRRSALATHLHGQRQLDLLTHVLAGFAVGDVQATVLKGLPLGERLYGDAFLRCSSDIDLHVPAAQRFRAALVLRSLGWTHVDGSAPWHEAWSRRDDDGERHLELHSSLLSDHLAHLPAPPIGGVVRDVAGMALRAHDGPYVPGYLAVHLATHQMPPLLWLVDFATLWWSLSEAERAAAYRGASDTRVARYLQWAEDRAQALRGAAAGDPASLRALGFDGSARKDVHSIWRHLDLAETPADRARLIAAFVIPRRVRGSATALVGYTLARLRTRLLSLGGARRAYGSASAPESHRQEARPLRVERSEMVSLVRDVVGAGGALRVRAPGGSMLPTIPRGALVRVQAVPARGIVRGDVVLALTADGEPVMHRVITVGGGFLVMRGDAALVADPPVPLARVIGVATHVTDAGEERPLGRSPRRSLSVAALGLRRRIARAVRRTP